MKTPNCIPKKIEYKKNSRDIQSFWQNKCKEENEIKKKGKSEEPLLSSKEEIQVSMTTNQEDETIAHAPPRHTN